MHIDTEQTIIAQKESLRLLQFFENFSSVLISD